MSAAASEALRLSALILPSKVRGSGDGSWEQCSNAAATHTVRGPARWPCRRVRLGRGCLGTEPWRERDRRGHEGPDPGNLGVKARAVIFPVANPTSKPVALVSR